MPLYAVDDIDKRIQYNGAWYTTVPSAQYSVGNYGPPFQGTLHGTQASGSLAFSFSGTSIRVIGSNNIRNVSGVLDPKWECFIDDTSIGSSDPFQYAENNWLFCSQSGLTDGPHTLTVNVTVVNAQTFWFDYILYTPSATVPSDGEYVWFEHSDSQLMFGAGWRRAGSIAHMTDQKGATFEFDFIGISLSWYSYIPIELPGSATTASYSIDDGASQTFALNGHAPSGGGSVYNQKFFEVLNLPMNHHTISVTYNGDANHTPLSLNYLVIKNGTGPTPSISIQNNASASAPISSRFTINFINTTSTTSKTIPGVTVTSTSSGTSSPPSISTAGRSHVEHGNKRIIIGVLVGVGSAALILLFGFLLYQRRRRVLRTNDALHTRPHIFHSSGPPGYPIPQAKSSRGPSSQGVGIGGLSRWDGNESAGTHLTPSSGPMGAYGDLPPAYTG